LETLYALYIPLIRLGYFDTLNGDLLLKLKYATVEEQYEYNESVLSREGFCVGLTRKNGVSKSNQQKT